MHSNYQLEERVIKNIIYNNIKCVQSDSKVNLIFYYKSPKTSSLVMKNNMSPYPTLLQQSSVIYKFSCPLPHSQAVEYVGLTQTTLSRRLMYHAQDGGICKHFMNCHKAKPTREQLTDNTTIIARAPDRFKLAIKEALYIIKLGPLINKQYDNFSSILKLYNHRNQTTKSAKTGSHANPYHLNLAKPSPPNLIPPRSPTMSVSPSLDIITPNLISLSPSPDLVTPFQLPSPTTPKSPNLVTSPLPNLYPTRPSSPTTPKSPNLVISPLPNLSPTQPPSPSIPISLPSQHNQVIPSQPFLLSTPYHLTLT